MSHVTKIAAHEFDKPISIDIRYVSGYIKRVDNVVSFGLAEGDEDFLYIFIEGKEYPDTIINLRNLEELNTHEYM